VLSYLPQWAICMWSCLDRLQFSSVQSLSCFLFVTPSSMPGFPAHHQLPELSQTHVHQVSVPSNHLIFCCPLLLLPSIFPSIRVFSNESVLCIRWPKYWSFSFSISPSSKYSGLISFRIWLVGSPCSSRDSQEFSLTPQFKSFRIDKSKQKED